MSIVNETLAPGTDTHMINITRNVALNEPLRSRLVSRKYLLLTHIHESSIVSRFFMTKENCDARRVVPVRPDIDLPYAVSTAANR